MATGEAGRQGTDADQPQPGTTRTTTGRPSRADQRAANRPALPEERNAATSTQPEAERDEERTRKPSSPPARKAEKATKRGEAGAMEGPLGALVVPGVRELIANMTPL